MDNLGRLRMILLVTSLVACLVGCSLIDEDAGAEEVAMRFFRGEASQSDATRDVKFQTTGEYGYNLGYEWVWAQPDAAQIDEIIVRDSLRPNSKEITVFFDLPDLLEDGDGWWGIDDGAAFIMVERIDGRWKVWCAELAEGASSSFPDICKYGASE